MKHPFKLLMLIFCEFIRYSPLDSCILQINQKQPAEWPTSWPERLEKVHSSLLPEENLITDRKHWKELISNLYMTDLGVNWSSVRNVMDLNAGFGGYSYTRTRKKKKKICFSQMRPL